MLTPRGSRPLFLRDMLAPAQVWNDAVGALVLAPLQATARFVATLKSSVPTPTAAHKLGGLLYAEVARVMDEAVRVGA